MDQQVELIVLPYFNRTITLTFGDQAENHVGMQKIGKPATTGFTFEDLNQAKERLERVNQKCELIHLNSYLPLDLQSESEPAYLLIIRKGVNYLLQENADHLFDEQTGLTPDSQAFMYGRVVNKKARHNLCFSEVSQEPNYPEGKGRIVAYSEVPLLNRLRLSLPQTFGSKAEGLVVEGNYYYDLTKCGIGFHGDSERRRVIGVRLGASLPFHYQWFQQSKPVGSRIKFNLNHGDMYVMSNKAVGTDWKKRKILTLRHAAGCPKFLTIKGQTY